jgi:hypothetical protein
MPDIVKYSDITSIKWGFLLFILNSNYKINFEYGFDFKYPI